MEWIFGLNSQAGLLLYSFQTLPLLFFLRLARSLQIIMDSKRRFLRILVSISSAGSGVSLAYLSPPLLSLLDFACLLGVMCCFGLSSTSILVLGSDHPPPLSSWKFRLILHVLELSAVMLLLLGAQALPQVTWPSSLLGGGVLLLLLSSMIALRLVSI